MYRGITFILSNLYLKINGLSHTPQVMLGIGFVALIVLLYTVTMRNNELTPKQEEFCQIYVTHGSDSFSDKRNAYRHAYDCKDITDKAANKYAAELMGLPKIQDRIASLRKKLARKARIKAEDIVEEWINIATTDVNELVQVRRSCCRHCYGFNHNYQWVEIEYAKALAMSIERGTKEPDATGGMDFDGRQRPVEDCPMCLGEGMPRVYVTDTRNLSEEAKCLYNGVRQTKFGPEIVLRNKDEALNKLAIIKGMFKNEGDSESMPLESIGKKTKDQAEAARLYMKMMK